MSRHVLTLKLKDEPGIVESYTRHHMRLWPEVRSSLIEAGIEQMDIYLLGCRLVMVVEMRDGVDYKTAFEAHASSGEAVAEWERLMQSLQERLPEARPGEWWALMEPVFHLDSESVAPVVTPAR
jgi:L-rhamnose mutarotase